MPRGRKAQSTPNGTYTFDMADAEEIGLGVHHVDLGNGMKALLYNENNDFGRSSSGKSTIHASTQGNVKRGRTAIGLNVFTKD